MTGKEKILKLLEIIDNASQITPKNKPITVNPLDISIDFFKSTNTDELENIFTKLENENVLKVIQKANISIYTLFGERLLRSGGEDIKGKKRIR